MTTSFIHDHFLLQSTSAIRLYHDFAKEMPIFDYHCHLPPQQIAENASFENLTQIWLAGDHYKWRALRAAGVDERYITGDASDWEKFEQWAAVVPKTIRNPLYHWTHLELNRPFGINDRLLNRDTAVSIWEECNAKLAKTDFSACGLMQKMNVHVVCTTDDPIDSLESHQKIAADPSFNIQVRPTFRPDKIVLVGDLAIWNQYIDQLAGVTNRDISSYTSLMMAIADRHAYFHANGCRLSDHGFGLFTFSDWSEHDVERTFEQLRAGKMVSRESILGFQSAVLYEMGKLDHDRNWTQQLHIGAIRNNRTHLYKTIGADAGADSIVDGSYAVALSCFLDRLDQENKLPRTIVYNLNPTCNDMLATMIGNFQDGSMPGKLQFGSGWWFLDQKHGMEQQLESLSNQGLLSFFVGMLTDSRSFLSYTRHEYFRRILCNLLGSEIEQGLIPNDFDMIGNMVKDICYNNAVNYFGFE